MARERNSRGSSVLRCGAFTLIELLVVIAIIAVLIGILLPALGEARRTAKLTIAIAREKQMSTATNSYAADYQDRIFAFTWEPGESYPFMDANGEIIVYEAPPPSQLNATLRAASHQAIDIIRRRADRIGSTQIPVPTNWIPHVLYTHLVLQDYLASRLPEPLVVNPEDRNRLNWQIDPAEKFDSGFWLPLQPDPTVDEDQKRWPYSASFQTVPASYDPMQSDLSNGEGNRLQQGASHNGYVLQGDQAVDFGGLYISDVAFPSSKVHLQDSHSRHFGKQVLFYAYRKARTPLAFFDSSVSVRRTQDSNPGWLPNLESFECDPFGYTPDTWEPPTLTGATSDQVVGWYRWTRGGLKGVDYGGKPLDTEQDDPGECQYGL